MDPMEGDENPITIDTTEHNHLQLLLCINELREHNGRTEAILSQVNHYIREQESTYQEKLEEERKQHQQTKQQLAATLRKLTDFEILYENLAKRNKKLELIIGHNIADDETEITQNGNKAHNNNLNQPGNGTNSLSAMPKEKSYRFSLKALSWSEKSRKRKSAPPGKNLQEEIRLELKFIQVAAVKIQAVVRGFIVKQRFRKMLIMNSKRNNIVREIFETEKSYVRNITTIVKVFLKPLRNSVHDGNPVIEIRLINYYGHIFSVIDQVLVAHDILMTMMERRLKKWTPYQKFGDIFLKDYMNNFQSVYSTYINNYNRAFATLNKSLNDNKNFAQFVKQAETKKECEMHDLLSFLIMPIQRIPRYKLLLLDLFKNTWESHIDYADIKSAVLKITEIASISTEILNENKRESEGSAAASILVAERERKEKEREAASRSLKRNTAILEDLSNFLKNSSSTWSDSENESSSPIGSPMPERVIPAEITEAQLDDMMMRMLATTGIPTGKNVYHLRVYEQSFAGASLVNWLAEYYPNLPRDKLMGFGQMLMDRGVITTIKTDQKYFRDSKTTLFRFKFYDKKEPTLNIPKQWLGPAVRDPISIANALAVIAVDTIRKYLMPDKKGVNFTKLADSPEFLALCLQTTELQRVEISQLTPRQKLVFFVNIHNSLLVHAHATVGPPRSVASAKTLADRWHKYSIEDIEQLILGGAAHFKKKSSKLQNLIPSIECDFMTMFSLATGTVDAPPIVAYDFDTQLETLATQFLQSQVEMKPSANEVWLPCLLWNRKADVWKDHKELVGKVLPLLKETQRNELTKMMAEKGKVEFKWRMHTWVPNYIGEDPSLLPEDGT